MAGDGAGVPFATGARLESDTAWTASPLGEGLIGKGILGITREVNITGT